MSAKHMSEFSITFVTEEMAASLISLELAYEAVRDAFIDISTDDGHINPVAVGNGFKDGESYTLKSGIGLGRDVVGFKVGSYWPSAEQLGLPRHSATTVLLDPATGRVSTVISASTINCYRTAAADAVAAHVLARKDSKNLALLGAGHQAAYEATALAALFDFNDIKIASRTPAHAHALCSKLRREIPRPNIQATTVDEAIVAADIIVTATTARAPLFQASLVKPGTHIASMGSDQQGKQELPPEIFPRASLFCDMPSQSIRIGEYQHIKEPFQSGPLTITSIGDVIRGVAPGRIHDDDITIFDSSGIALQDLYIADKVSEICKQST